MEGWSELIDRGRVRRIRRGLFRMGSPFPFAVNRLLPEYYDIGTSGHPIPGAYTLKWFLHFDPRLILDTQSWCNGALLAHHCKHHCFYTPRPFLITMAAFRGLLLYPIPMLIIIIIIFFVFKINHNNDDLEPLLFLTLLIINNIIINIFSRK